MTKASTIEKNQELIAGFKTPEEIISSRMQSDQKAKREPNALVYDMRLGWAPEYIDNPIGHRKSFRNKRLCPIIRRWKQLYIFYILNKNLYWNSYLLEKGKAKLNRSLNQKIRKHPLKVITESCIGNL